MKQWQQTLFGILIGLCMAAVLWLLIGRPKGQGLVLAPVPTASGLVVHVDGQVIKPGVYKLEPGSRVVDAIQAAGGFSIEANTAAINQADLVNDGSRIVVPRIGESAVVEGEIVTFTSGSRAGMININLASEEQLDTLPEIGPKTAQQIILYRQEHGNFVRIEDIMNVPGIGQATFDKIRDLIEVE